MRKWLILGLVFSLSPIRAQTVWTWVDSDGTVHYSDRPQPGAEPVDIPEVQTFSRPALTPRSQSQGTTTSSSAATSYRSVTIASPAQDENLWNIGATLEVSIETQPALAPGHRVDLVYDGQRMQGSAGTTFTLENVFRGTHTLQAMIVDASTGSELRRSDTRTFQVHQTSVQNPANPLAPSAPNAPPRPRPRPGN